MPRRLLGLVAIAVAMPVFSAQTQTPGAALGDCYYDAMTRQDRDLFVQWAFVALGRSSAAREIAQLPANKIKSVELRAQKRLTDLTLRRCIKPAGRVLLKDPKDGLQDALQQLAKRLVTAELERRTQPMLPLTITDLLDPKQRLR